MVSTIDAIGSFGIVPVVDLPDGASAVEVASALADAGLDTIEITLRRTGAIEAIAAIRRAGVPITVAAGTVLTAQQVEEAAGAGASLIVSPGFSRTVIERAGRLGVAVLPGVATASEIQAGLELGLQTFKFFPAEVIGGIPLLRALAGPFGQVSFVPTGGIGPSNAGAYLQLPNVIAVGGSWLVPREAAAANDMSAIQRIAADAKAIVARARACAAGEAC